MRPPSSPAGLLALLPLLPLVLAPACASTPAPAQAGSPELIPAGGAASPSARTAGPGQAHALVIDAAACWFGGLWSDAEGATRPELRRLAGEKRCHDVASRLSSGVEEHNYDAVRDANNPAVDRLSAEVERLAKTDPLDGPRKDALQKLLRAVAVAQRENNAAHRAADTVKRDLKDGVEPQTLSADEVAAVGPMRAHAALEALLQLDAGDLSAEAHLMAVLCAMDRMELARGLPKHLKVYAVGDAYKLVFRVPPPDVPADATTKLTPGLWLTYLTTVAQAAGHAVPGTATGGREREPWAWGGALEGFADRLRADAPGLPADGETGRVARAIIKRLDAEWADVPAIAADQKMIGDRETKAKK